MTHLTAIITARQLDGSFNWTREGAKFPKGRLPAEIAPEGLDVGQRVRILIQSNERGEHLVSECSLLEDGATVASFRTVTESSSVNENAQTHSTPPRPHSGSLHWVVIINPLENPLAEGKLRPAVLIEQSGVDSWKVMGLTTKHAYSDGSLRTPIPNHRAVGLSKEGFLWGDSLTRITSDSIGDYIGEADAPLLTEIINISRTNLDRDQLEIIRNLIQERSTSGRAQFQSSLLSPRLIDRVSPSSISFTDLGTFFQENRTRVQQDLINYFTTRSGRYFDILSGHGNPWRFDGSEVAAATCLSLEFRHHMIASMMEIAPRLNELLQQVPIDLTLWEANDEDLEPNSPLCLMYGLLDDLPGFGSAYVSKLMAAKRPQLVPIRDKAVSELLGNPVAWWSNWRAVLVQGQLRRVLVEIRSACGLPHISLLRIADAALWEYSQRDH